MENYIEVPWKTANLSYDPTIPLPGIYPNKTVTQKATRPPMFMAALFTIARHGNNLNAHPQTNRYRRCGTNIQWNTAHSWKEQNNASFSNVDATTDYHTK